MYVASDPKTSAQIRGQRAAVVVLHLLAIFGVSFAFLLKSKMTSMPTYCPPPGTSCGLVPVLQSLIAWVPISISWALCRNAAAATGRFTIWEVLFVLANVGIGYLYFHRYSYDQGGLEYLMTAALHMVTLGFIVPLTRGLKLHEIRS